jgi:hypothetical protein
MFILIRRSIRYVLSFMTPSPPDGKGDNPGTPLGNNGWAYPDGKCSNFLFCPPSIDAECDTLCSPLQRELVLDEVPCG